jgi:hypothetical protein
LPGLREARLHRALRASALLLLAAASLACITRRVDISLAPPPPTPYSASVHASFTVGGHGLSADGGCAVDPARGVRLELRDPSGSARLLMLLRRGAGEIVAPGPGLVFRWTAPTEEMPFAPADLWFLFTGTPPPDLRDLQATEKGLTYAAWAGPGGSRSCRLAPSSGGASPFESADLRGPAGTELRLAFRNTRAGDFPDAAFAAPAGLALTEAPLAQILQETSR